MIMKTKFFFLLLLTYFLVIPAQEITGSWKGELEIQGAKLPLIVHFSKNDSVYKGTLDSPNQSATGIPMDKVEFNDKKVSFEIKSIGLPVSYTHLDVYKRQLQHRKNEFQPEPNLSLIHI